MFPVYGKFSLGKGCGYLCVEEIHSAPTVTFVFRECQCSITEVPI